MVDEDFPEDTDDPDLVAIPSKQDLDLGRPLVRRFADEVAPHLRDEIDACFSRKGASGRFKDLLARAKLLDRWYEYEHEHMLAAVKEWAEEEGFGVMAPSK